MKKDEMYEIYDALLFIHAILPLNFQTILLVIEDTLFFQHILNLSIESLFSKLIKLYFPTEVGMSSEDFLCFFGNVRSICGIFSIFINNFTLTISF